MKKLEILCHPFPPIYDTNYKILLLGSFPSVKSRETKFYYGNPKNRFWIVLAKLFNEECPLSIESKTEFLLRHNIALWDTLKSCSITGSSDNSIKNPIPNDFDKIIAESKISQIFCIGKTSYTLFTRLTNLNAIYLPSPSPANCAMSIDKLVDSYRIILNYL